MPAKHFFWVRGEPELIEASAPAGPRKSVFLCTNEDAGRACLAGGLPSVLLDEDLIRADHRRINVWAIEQALSFIRQHRGDRQKYLFLESNFYDVKSVFIRSLKYILVLEKILAGEREAELTAFGDGRSLLEITYAEYSRTLNPSFKFNLLPKTEKQPALNEPRRFKAAVHKMAGLLMNAACRFNFNGSFKKKKGEWIFVSGALHHLAPVLEEFRKAGYGIVYGESRFNLEKSRYCASKGIGFRVFPELRKWENPFRTSPLCQGSGRIIFDGRDLTALYNTVFSHLEDVGLLNVGFDPEAIDEFFKKYKPSRVLLDEDFAVRRVFMILAKERAIPCFAVSHGVPTVTMLGENEKPADGYYETAVTLVTSELEKSVYKSFFYNPEKLVVTGTPRYDALAGIRRAQTGKKKHAAGRKTILYAAQSTRSYDFEDHWAADLLGSRTLHLDYTRRYLKDLLEMMTKNQNLFLRIKPHYEQKEAWRALVGGAARGGRCELLSSEAPIFDLLEESDLVVTMPSSVVCEAIMLEKPVIVLNYGNDDLGERYERTGSVAIVREKVALSAAIQKYLYDEKARSEMASCRERHFQYLAGRFDGASARRVAERILSA